jgi:hypothetical protein
MSQRAGTGERARLTSGGGVSATKGGRRADQSGPAPGGAGADRRAQGHSARARTVIRGSEPLDQGQTVAMGGAGLYSSVTGVAPSAATRSPDTRQTRSPGILGSPGRARTGQEGLANSLAGTGRKNGTGNGRMMKGRCSRRVRQLWRGILAEERRSRLR